MLRSASASHVVSARWSEQPEQPTAILQTLIYPLVWSQNKWFISDDWTLGFRFGSKADVGRRPDYVLPHFQERTSVTSDAMSGSCQKPTSLISHDMNVFPTACCTWNRSPSTLAERQLDHD
jgi:hypothetical protein